MSETPGSLGFDPNNGFSPNATPAARAALLERFLSVHEHCRGVWNLCFEDCWVALNDAETVKKEQRKAKRKLRKIDRAIARLRAEITELRAEAVA
jgi:hypothetical protein